MDLEVTQSAMCSPYMKWSSKKVMCKNLYIKLNIFIAFKNKNGYVLKILQKLKLIFLKIL